MAEDRQSNSSAGFATFRLKFTSKVKGSLPRPKSLQSLKFANSDRNDSTKPPFQREKISVYMLDGTMPYWQHYFSRISGANFLLNSCLRSSSQVMLVNNPVAGLIILVALGYSDPRGILFAITGLLCSNSMAVFMAFDPDLVCNGLLGFNGMLCAMAISAFVPAGSKPAAAIFPLITAMFSSAVSAIFMVAFANGMVPTLKVPPMTLPFNAITAPLLLTAVATPRLPVATFMQSTLPGVAVPAAAAAAAALSTNGTIGVALASNNTAAAASSVASSTASLAHAWAWQGGPPLAPSTGASALLLLRSTLAGVSQVYFSPDPVAGGLILVALALASRISALFAFLGSAVGVAVGLFFGAPPSELQAGLWGYNPCLCATALGGFFFLLTPRSALLALLAAATSAVFNRGLRTVMAPAGGTPTLTLAFCLTTLLFSLLHRSARGLIPIPIAEITTPEGALRRAAAAAAAHKHRNCRHIVVPRPPPGATSDSEAAAARRSSTAEPQESKGEQHALSNGIV